MTSESTPPQPEEEGTAQDYLDVMAGDTDPAKRERVRKMIDDPNSKMNQEIAEMKEEEAAEVRAKMRELGEYLNRDKPL